MGSAKYVKNYFLRVFPKKNNNSAFNLPVHKMEVFIYYVQGFSCC